MRAGNFAGLLLYIFCWIIQFLTAKAPRYALLGALQQLLYGLSLFYVPYTIYEFDLPLLINLFGPKTLLNIFRDPNIFSNYRPEFYVVLVLMAAVLVWNVKMFLDSRRSGASEHS
ncbi:MAG: hypothetical protein Q4C82_00415 [Eubacteriales bacterium]|nr:hypothetical protein [Eubacteriales bacterium]